MNMQINKIRPETKTDDLRSEIERVFRDVFKTQVFWKGNTLNITFRLTELKPQDTNYRLSKYWNVEERKYYHDKCLTSSNMTKDEMENEFHVCKECEYAVECHRKKLVAVNSALGSKIPIKRGYSLQEEDWILVNQTLNRICDQLGISCTIRSSLIKIREGVKNVWLPNYLELLKDIVEVKGEDYTYSDALQKAIETANVEDKYKFESVFLTEPLEVTEDTRITQKVFTDYDELDALAKAYGYVDRENNSSYCGWIATMGDSSHNPITMLKEAMRRLSDAKAKGEDVVMGFCQTGNFSVGYTIYTRKIIKGEPVTDISFDDYNDYCTDCDDHDKCHVNGSIDYEKVAKCKEEIETLKKGERF